jgi:hypothetical protein
MREGGSIIKRVVEEERERSSEVSRLGIDGLLYNKREGLRLGCL